MPTLAVCATPIFHTARGGCSTSSRQQIQPEFCPAIACDKSARQGPPTPRRQPAPLVHGEERGLDNRFNLPLRSRFFPTLRGHHSDDPIQARAQRGQFCHLSDGGLVAGSGALRTHAGDRGTPRRRGSDGRERQSPTCFHRLAAHRFVASRYVMRRLDRAECQKATAFGRGRDSAILTVMSPAQSKADGGAVVLGVYLMGAMAVNAYVTCANWPFNSARKVYYGLPGRRVYRHTRRCTRGHPRWARTRVVEVRCHTASNGAVPLRPRLLKVLPWRSMSEARCVAAT